MLLQGSPGTSKAPAAAKGAAGGAAAATGTATAAAGTSISAAEAAAAATAAGISAGGLLRPTGPNVRAADWAWLAMLCWKVQDNLTSTFLQALKSGDRMQQRTAVGIMSNLSEVSAGAAGKANSRLLPLVGGGGNQFGWKSKEWQAVPEARSHLGWKSITFNVHACALLVSPRCIMLHSYRAFCGCLLPSSHPCTTCLSLMCGVGGHAVVDMVINHSCCPRPSCLGDPFASTYFPV